MFIIISLKMAWVYGRKRSDFITNTTVKMNCFALKSVVFFLSFVILKKIDSDSLKVYRRVEKLSKRITKLKYDYKFVLRLKGTDENV